MWSRRKVMNCSVAKKKSVRRVCYSLNSQGQNPSRSFWGRRKWRRRRRNTCEKSGKCSKKREWEFQGHREEERVWCCLERSSGKINLREFVMWGTPIIPCVCYYWDGRGFLAGFMRASSSCEKSRKRSKKRRVWEFQGVSWWRGKGLMFVGEI